MCSGGNRITLYKEDHNKLNNWLNNNIGKFSCILVLGEYGKGKTTLITQVCESKHCLSVCQYAGMNTPFEALFSPLYKMLEEYNYDIATINNEISHREYVKQLFINICKQTPELIIFFHDMRDYDDILVELIKESMQYLSKQQIPCHIIMEFSTNNLSPAQQDRLCTCKDICFKRIELKCDIEEYADYFRYLLNGKSRITEKQIDSILKESFYNPALIKKMVYYFMDMGIFYEKDDYWFSDELDFQLTAQLFEEHIFLRYEKLSEDLKKTLNKASITGYEIDSRLLSYPLGIVKSEENLRRIERLSRLINQTENSYVFENNTVYNAIYENISASEKKALHLLVAEHLYSKINDYQRIRPTKVLRLLYIIKKHYIDAERINAALHVNGCYIQKAYQQRNYDAALSGIKEFIDLSDGRYPFAEQQFIYLEADVFIILGEFENAYRCLQQINKRYIPHGQIHWIEYKEAYSLFNFGKTGEACKIAEDLVDKLDSNDLDDTYLLLKLDILLSGLYHHFGDVRNASRRYNQAMDIASQNEMYHKEYNYLLSISNMFLANEFAIPKIEESMAYFKANDLLISYAKGANNVAINYIYTGDFTTAQKYLEESSEIFLDICSSSAHYPINNLGTVYACQQDYAKALELFKQARDYQVEPFSKIWIDINIANCLRKQGDINEAKSILGKVEKHIYDLTENKFLLERNLHIANGLLALEEKNYSIAYDHCEEALNIEVNKLDNDTYPVFLGKVLDHICELANLKIPDIAIPYCNSFMDSFCKNLLDNNAHWGNFLFWEA